MANPNYIYEENPESLTHQNKAADNTDFSLKRLKMMQKLHASMSAIADTRVRGNCQSAYHHFFSDLILRPLYINKIAGRERRKVLSDYQAVLRKVDYSTIRASRGAMNKLLSLLVMLPTPLADTALKLTFSAKRLVR